MALCGGVAQLVAHLSGTQKVEGSSPSVSTTYRVSGRFRYMGHWPSSSVYARTNFSAQDVETRLGGTRGAQDASRITG